MIITWQGALAALLVTLVLGSAVGQVAAGVGSSPFETAPGFALPTLTLKATNPVAVSDYTSSRMPITTPSGWSDSFDDAQGILLEANTSLAEGLLGIDGLVLTDNFTGPDGATLNSGFWTEYSGGIGNAAEVEIESNRVKTLASPNSPQGIYARFGNGTLLDGRSNITLGVSVNNTSGGSSLGGDVEVINASTGNPHARLSVDKTISVADLYTEQGSGLIVRESSPAQVFTNTDYRLRIELTRSSAQVGIYSTAGAEIWRSQSWAMVGVDAFQLRLGVNAYGIGGDNTCYWDDAEIRTGVWRGEVVSVPVSLPGNRLWKEASWVPQSPQNTLVRVSVLDTSLEVIPGFENLTNSPIDLSDLDPILYPSIHLRGELTGNGTHGPSLDAWGVIWYEGSPFLQSPIPSNH